MLRLIAVAARLALTALLVMGLPAASFSQMTRGSIAGVVRDSSGGVVPGASMTIINVGTNAKQSVTSDAAGFYRAPALEPGRYTVVAELAGFRKLEQRDVDVRSALETPLDVKLAPAGIGETVQVSAEVATAGLNKNNPTIANTISARAIEDLPLPGGRNVTHGGLRRSLNL